jgi:hypothetical protein
MKEKQNLRKCDMPMTFFFLFLFLSTVVGLQLSNSYGEELLITASSSSSVESTNPSNATKSIETKNYTYETTTIIEFTNIGKDDVASFRIWLDNNFNFKAFKTERGWIGEKTPQGVIILTSSDSVKFGESIKIGIKTNLANPEINWQALDKNEKQVGIGKIIPAEILEPILNLKIDENGILDKSSFRIIPERPNAGDKFRVTGNNFGASQPFDFYIDTQQLGTFVTNSKGYFMTTMTVPSSQPPERSEFVIKDSMGNEKKISLRIGEEENKIPITKEVKLSIQGIPDIMQIGDLLEISGTANPNSVIAGKIKNSGGIVINTRTSSVNAKGEWKLEEPILVPLDSALGKYSVEITDGRETITKSWIIESSKVITITPLKLKFNPGEKIIFNGTALPNLPIELSLKDPLGTERLSNIIYVDDSGFVKFEYPTTANVDKDGTWTLVAIQGDNREFIYVGLDQLPSIPIHIEFDKLNYKSTESAIISLSGKAGDLISMLIVDPADKPKNQAIPITIENDGKTIYELPLKGYSSGIYTAVISKGNSKSTETFAVGLQTGSGDIRISTTKLDYSPNDSVLILGQANKNSIIIFSLFDPNGTMIKEIESFTDKEGKISEDGFRIPLDGEPGKWKINAKSGSNFKTMEIEVIASKTDGMVISTSEGTTVPRIMGKSIDIKVINAAHTVQIKILGPDGELIDELAVPASDQGEVKIPWVIPQNTSPGNYTATAKDGNNFAETTFLIT